MDSYNVKNIKNLIAELNHASYVYYVENDQIMSDKEWDDKFDRLKSLEEKTGIVFSNSPTQNVGYTAVNELKKVTHSHPMLSLSKTKSVDELRKFRNNRSIIISCKMDGLTVLLTYNNHKLVKAETRGNGIEGEDITHNAMVFENIPLTIPFGGFFEIEGEAIITYDDFEKINSKLPEGEKYRNPRNLVSGSVRQLDSNIAKRRHIKFIAWKLPSISYATMEESFKYAEQLGFEVVPYRKDTGSIDMMIDGLKFIAKKLSYPIDGMVVSYDNIAYGKSLGATGHHPRHSIAFKFYDDEYETTLKNIEWTMGKTSTLTPTAVFNPVEIDGTMVERASLHNITIMSNTLGEFPYEGQTIYVIKANQIIPQVVNADKENQSADNERRFKIPHLCPICNGSTKITKENDSEVLECTNPNCRGKLLGKLSHFVSREAINIDGMSESTLQKFITIGIVSDFSDLYHLEKNYNLLVNLSGFGKKSVDKLFENIEASRNTTLKRFLYSLSIDLIGNTASKLIEAEVLKNMNPDSNLNPFEQFCQMTLNNYDWTKIDGLGDKMSASLKEYFNINYDRIYDLSKEFIFKDDSIPVNDSSGVTGKTFVVTGSVKYFTNRKELQKFIEENGGKVVGSVSSKTDYLINNDIDSNSSKNNKAKSLHVPIINEEEFLRLANKWEEYFYGSISK